MLIAADARKIPLQDKSVQCVVTSPPYWGLRDYGVAPSIWGASDCAHVWGDSVTVNATNHTDKRRWNHTRNGRDEEHPTDKRVAWLRTVVDQGKFCQSCGAWRGALGLEPTPELFVDHIVDIFAEVRRVLRDDGTLWLNLGDSYSGSGKGGNPDEGKQSTNKGSQSIGVLYGKTGETARQAALTNVSRRWTTEACIRPKQLIGIPWRVAFALQSDGWYLRSDIIWAKPNPMPESVTDRPTKSHEYVFLLSKSERYYYDADAIAEPVSGAMLLQMEQGYGGLGIKDYESAGVQNPSSVKARIIANARLKGNARTFRGGGAYTGGQSFDNSVDAPRQSHGNIPNDDLTRNARSVWTIATQPYPDAHFATFPEALPERCICAGSKMGDLIFDPFIGSGTVGAVAERLGRRWVGTDLAYHDLSAARTAQRGLQFA